MKIITVTSKGQIVIPSVIRKKMNIKKGVKLLAVAKKGEIVLKPVTKDCFHEMAGILPTKGRLTRQLLIEREKDKLKEEQK